VKDAIEGQVGDAGTEQDVEQRYRRVLEGLVGIPATEGNQVEILRNGDEIFPAMLEAIEQAENSVDFTTYVYWTGGIAQRFARTLAARARAGVRVRVLLDAVGAFQMKGDLASDMTDAGVHLQWFRNVKDADITDADHRTHRKVLVCDEDVAFIGGVGIAEEWEGDARDPSEWRDTHVRVHGPAVDGLRAAFVDNWAETGQELFDETDRFPEQERAGDSLVQVVSSPSQTGWSTLDTMFVGLLGVARERVRITSAYFVPEDHVLAAICAAAERGVRVDVLLPGEHTDKRIVQAAGEAKYEPLLACGVHVHRYDRTMLHAKVMTVDGYVACVGSANMDARSMKLNEESNLVIFDADVAAELDRHFDEDLERSTEVDAETWKDRGAFQQAVEGLVGAVEDRL
jgi:cardiolipin synthase